MPPSKNADVVHRGTNSVATAHLDDNKLYVHTEYFDDAALERNRQLRNAGILDKGKLGLHENEDIRMAFSCPSLEQWNRFKKHHPETHALLTSTVEAERMRG